MKIPLEWVFSAVVAFPIDGDIVVDSQRAAPVKPYCVTTMQRTYFNYFVLKLIKLLLYTY